MMTIPIWLYLLTVALAAFLGFTLCIVIALVDFERDMIRLIKKYQLPRTGQGDER